MGNQRDTGAWQALRAHRKRIAAANGEPCCRCHQPIDYQAPYRIRNEDGTGSSSVNRWYATADHLDPLVLHGDQLPTLDRLAPAHLGCNSSHGTRLRNRLTAASNAQKRHDQGAARARRGPVSDSPGHPDGTLRGDLSPMLSPKSVPHATNSGSSPASPQEPAEGSGWPEGVVAGLWGLEAPPVTGTWPRFMTGPHPRAVGSYGPEFVAWAEARPGLHPKRTGGLRWFQKLVAYRMLEHDQAGDLVWEWVILTISRQQGKSWLCRAVLAWALEQTERWGPATVLSIAHKLAAAAELWRPAARWAGSLSWQVRHANGQECIESPQGSRWLIAAANEGAGVSMSLNRVLVDEAWRIGAVVVEEYIHPTMAEAESPQLMLVSTAGDSSSELMRGKRAAGFAQLDAPVDVLLVEWSAPPASDVWDRAGWRSASGHWDARRERVLEGAARQLLVGSEGNPPNVAAFKMQWLNQWVPVLVGVEPWLRSDLWEAGHAPGLAPVGAVVAAVEDRFGRGGFAAAGWRVRDRSGDDPGLVAVVAAEFGTLGEAWSWADQWHPALWLHGVSLRNEPEVVERAAEPVGSAELGPALATMRTLVEGGALAWDGATLADNCLRLVVKDHDTRGGLQLVATAGVRSGGVRCAAWVAHALSQRQVGADFCY